MSRTAVVTGATDGIGLATAAALAGAGWEVIGVGRSEARCAAAVEAVRLAAGGNPRYVAGDLSTAEGVREAAARLRGLLEGRGGALDLLVHAAGAVSSERVANSEGCELQLAVNHLAPFLLTRELLGCLSAAPTARVIVVGSRSHRHARLDWDDVMMRRGYSLLAAYKRSKLCAVAFAIELSRRLFYSSIDVFAFDPGLVRTDIGLKGTHGAERAAWRIRRLLGASPEVPARRIARLAEDPKVKGRTGLYLRGGRPIRPDRLARDPDFCRRLWSLSERLCGIEKRYFSILRKRPLGCEGVREPDRPTCSAVVCAYNEEKTVASVIDGLLASKRIDEIVVVDDGSRDGTAAAIRTLEAEGKIRGVYVWPNRGKGNAMAEGLSASRGDFVLFVDADLVNWNADYAQAVLDPVLRGVAGMAIGYPYRESLFWDRVDPFHWQRRIAGERAVRRSDILPLLPAMRASRFGVETLINMHCKSRHAIVKFVRLDGLVHPIKFEKTPGPRAWKGYAQEAAHILATILRHPLYAIMSTIPDFIEARDLLLAALGALDRRRSRLGDGA